MDDLHLNLENPAYYFNRELSWLEFNKRVIQEADISENPLLEQINFLAIGSSNLDEFFMIRVAGLQDQLQFDPGSRDSKTQLNAEEQLEEIARKNRQNITLQYDLLDKRKEDLKKYEVHFTNLSELTDSELAEVTEYYDTLIFPALTPLGIDAYHPFPRLNNKVMHLFVSLTKDEEKHTAVIPISNFLERFYLLETEETVKVVLLEEIIQANIHRLFNGYDVLDSFTFRITRNADFDVHQRFAVGYRGLSKTA